MTNLAELLPPQNLEAEQCLLGAILLNAEATFTVQEILQPTDFYTEGHRWVYTAIRELSHQHKPVDLQTVGTWLRDHQHLEQIGGTLYLTTIMHGTPGVAAATHYAKQIRECAIRRRMIAAADTIMTAAYTNVDATSDDLREMSERLIFDAAAPASGRFSGPRPIAEFAKQALYRQMDAIEDARAPGIKAGWKSVDSALRPITPGQLVILAARSGMGKTTFMLQWAMNLARQGYPGVMFSLEMDGVDLSQRALLTQMSYTQDHLDDIAGCQEDTAIMREFCDAVETVWELPIFIDDTSGLKVSDMDAILRRHTREHGKPTWVMVDYLQLAEAEGRSSSRSVEVGKIAKALKDLAKTHHCVVIALSQVNDEVEKMALKIPTLSTIYESRAIVNAADIVAYLYRPSYYGREELHKYAETRGYSIVGDRLDGITEFGELKMRFGQCRTVALMSELANYRFRDMTSQEWALLLRGQQPVC